MRTHSVRRLVFWTIALLISTLACRTATRLIIPDTPTPLPPTPTFTLTPLPTIPPPTPTPVFEAACPSLLAEIMRDATGPVTSSDHGATSRSLENEQDLYYMVTYSLHDDKLGTRDAVLLPDNFAPDLDARDLHEWIWNYFAALIPAEQRDFVSEFSVITDGQSRILGGVSRTLPNPAKWGLRVDVMDASDHYSLTFTLMHEFGHLLTLNSSQVEFDKNVFYNPDDQALYERAVAACPQYFSDEGCSAPNSYLNEFFQRYWTSFYAEWQEIDANKGRPSYYGDLRKFYKKYQDQFLSDYAPTSPEEDIAESWAFFVLAPKPEPTSIADEKILFFYDHPELVQLRQEILTRLCADFTK